MQRVFVCAKEGVLQGVFTQKKLLWEDLEKDKDVPNCIIRLSETKQLPLTYDRLCRYLTQRGMLKIYLDEDLEEFAAQDMSDECPATFKIWDVTVNQHYVLEGAVEPNDS